MLQVVPAVALHDIEQQQRTADRARLRARVAGAGNDEVGSGHEVGDPVGVAERAQAWLRLREGG
jgi:hypothetical protein